jgi:hypothetical protein
MAQFNISIRNKSGWEYCNGNIPFLPRIGEKIKLASIQTVQIVDIVYNIVQGTSGSVDVDVIVTEV